MNNLPKSDDQFAHETHALYVHLLNLRRDNGEPATDSARLHQENAESADLRVTLLDAAALARYIAGTQELAPEHLTALRGVLDRAHRRVVDPKFNWKPRWLNAPQGARHAYPSLPSHGRHHHPMGS